MVEQQTLPLDRVFAALSDLPDARCCGNSRAAAHRGELAEPFDMSLRRAAKHVKVLEGAGLLSRTIEGRSHRCRLEAGPARRGRPVAGVLPTLLVAAPMPSASGPASSRQRCERPSMVRLSSPAPSRTFTCLGRAAKGHVDGSASSPTRCARRPRVAATSRVG